MSVQQEKNTMAEVEKFKSAIVKIRDILRLSAVHGMDSMRHICLYITLPYLTLKKIKDLNIPEEFAWENCYELLKGDEDINLQNFKNDLIYHFDKLFGTQNFTFEIKSGVKHKEILGILSNINMQDVDLHMDILGYIYEQHLKTGASAARDLGQFFTDRFICEYMVKLCNPKIKQNGIPESICDPTMGTGGFLTAYLKHFKNVDWSVYQSEVHGVDHDAKVAGVARLNMFMESKGQIFKHLHTADSLHGGLDPTSYDIILANMPFGLKGLKYADVHSSIKNLGLNGTKSEPLFLQLMMVSLNKGGRCAVVVPDGMLVNNSKCHNGTRKYLLENFELKRVIKMKGKFFMNTGIQPSIIFFENSGKKTEQVEFWDVERDDKGNFSEQIVISVAVEKFDDSYSLDMRKYEETEELNYNEEIRILSLKEICKVSFGERITQKDNKGTLYPVYGSGGNTFNTDNFNREGMTCKIGRFALSEENMVMFVNGPYWLLDSGFTVESKDENIVLTKFLWYSMLKDKKRLCSISTGSCQKNIDMTEFYKLKYPIPSLEIQNQIIEELNAIYESKKNALNMIENLKKHMKNIVKSIDYRNYKLNKLKDVIIKTAVGKTNSTSISDTGEYPFYGCTNIVPSGTHSSYDFDDDEYLLFAKSGGNSKTPVSDNLGIGKFHYVKGKSAGNIAIFQYKITNNSLSYKYLEYILKGKLPIIQSLARYTTGNGNIDVASMLDIIEIPVPPLEVQAELVKRLDALSEQIACLEKIESQADENAKFVLDGYLGTN